MYPHFFDAAALGESLKEVATDLLKADGQDIVHRWFHSPKDADLFIWLDQERNVIKQQITFYGQVVEWNIIEGVKTGLIVEDESKAMMKGADVIHFDAKAQRRPVEQALSLLSHVSTLNDLERQNLRRNFADGPTSKSLAPDEFIRRYGSLLPPKQPGSKLRRLLSWFRKLFE